MWGFGTLHCERFKRRMLKTQNPHPVGMLGVVMLRKRERWERRTERRPTWWLVSVRGGLECNGRYERIVAIGAGQGWIMVLKVRDKRR